MTKCSPHKVLLGYCPSTAEEPILITNNETVEEWHQLIQEHQTVTLQALNKITQTPPGSQHQVGNLIWFKAKHLTLPYASAKLTPKCHSPLKILSKVSPVTYQLELPQAWTIHDIFHSSLLSPYKETTEHGANYQWPPPELIGNKEEYEVEQIINHRHHRKQCQLQFLIQWKGYLAADDTWEPTDQVHAPDLVRRYQKKHVITEGKYKGRMATWARLATFVTPWQTTCLLPTLPTSLLPVPWASLLTWTLLSHSPLDLRLRHQWSTSKTASQFPWRLWQPPMRSVSCSSLPGPYALLLKGTAPQVKKSSFTLPKDWQELCKRTKRSVTATMNS